MAAAVPLRCDFDAAQLRPLQSDLLLAAKDDQPIRCGLCLAILGAVQTGLIDAAKEREPH